MKTNKRILLIAWTLVMLLATGATAHGTRGYAEPGSGVRIVAEYDDGGPMSYCKVEVTAPDSEIAFQSGYTDRNGLFLFAPDQPGVWRLAVLDGMGHRLSFSHEVTETSQRGDAAQPPAPTAAPQNQLPHRQSALVGLCLIFGVSGWIYSLRKRRSV